MVDNKQARLSLWAVGTRPREAVSSMGRHVSPWAADFPVKGQWGRMQMVEHSQLWVSQKVVAFNNQGPPPSACT